MKRRVIILGGGISGLTLAWQLCKRPENFDVVLLEAAASAGGWLASHEQNGFFFEKGPRTFQTRRSLPLLELIKDLGIEDQIVASDESAAKRFLWIDGKLTAFPKPLLKLAVLKSFVKEFWISPKLEDESIADFAMRRFGKEVAERLFDPLVLGVYGGDMRELSMQSCFPFFKKMELEHGSVLKGMLLRKKMPKEAFPISASLFSLKKGCGQLVQTLVEKLASSIRLNEAVEELSLNPKGVDVRTTRGTYSADLVISALPPQQISQLLQPHDRKIATQLSAIPMKNLKVVYMGFDSKCLKQRGFGYLVPSRENEKVYGAIFDSAVFPAHNRDSEQTRLTYMVRDSGQSEEESTKIALDAAKRHLQIEEKPAILGAMSAQSAIPQYLVGHAEMVERLQTALRTRFSRLHLVGNYLAGASVSDRIAESVALADRLSTS